MSAKKLEFVLYVMGDDEDLGVLNIIDNVLKHSPNISYNLEVKNIFDNEAALDASEKGIFSIPSLLKQNPAPEKIILNTEELLKLLEAVKLLEED